MLAAQSCQQNCQLLGISFQVRASSVPDVMQRLLARSNCFASPRPADRPAAKQPPPAKLLGAIDILQVVRRQLGGRGDIMVFKFLSRTACCHASFVCLKHHFV